MDETLRQLLDDLQAYLSSQGRWQGMAGYSIDEEKALWSRIAAWRRAHDTT